MRYFIILTAFLASPAFAQSSGEADADADANASLDLDSTTTAYVDGRSYVYGDSGDGVADGTYVYDGRIENVPHVVAPDLGSGHPCALPYSGGISVVGLGATGGTATVDEPCMLLRSNNPVWQAAAVATYASRDKTLCKHLRALGAIAQSSTCGEPRRSRTVAASKGSARPAKPPKVQFTRCELAADGTLKVAFRKRHDRAVGMAQCKARVGMN